MAQERGITSWLSIVARYHSGALQDFYCTRGNLIDLNVETNFIFPFQFQFFVTQTFVKNRLKKKVYKINDIFEIICSHQWILYMPHMCHD